MCRTDLRHLGAVLGLMLLLQGCSREETRTVVLSPSTGLPPVSAPAAPPATAASGVPARKPTPEPSSPPSTQPATQAPAQQATPPTAPSGPTAATPSDPEGARLLAARKPVIPVEGIAASALRDNYEQGRGASRKHEAIDIMAPRGTRVFAVDDGKLVKLFYSKAGGITVYQFDPAGELSYYYAHLDRYADGLKEGMALKRGDLIGYVGVSGNSAPDAPHLHFGVYRLGPDKKWWQGAPVNPYPALRGAGSPSLAAR